MLLERPAQSRCPRVATADKSKRHVGEDGILETLLAKLSSQDQRNRIDLLRSQLDNAVSERDTTESDRQQMARGHASLRSLQHYDHEPISSRCTSLPNEDQCVSGNNTAVGYVDRKVIRLCCSSESITEDDRLSTGPIGSPCYRRGWKARPGSTSCLVKLRSKLGGTSIHRDSILSASFSSTVIVSDRPDRINSDIALPLHADDVFAVVVMGTSSVFCYFTRCAVKRCIERSLKLPTPFDSPAV